MRRKGHWKTEEEALRHKRWRSYAYVVMHSLIRREIVFRVDLYDCVDCGSQAEIWEHRDYSRPLEIEPACESCNAKRGPGWSPSHEPPQTRPDKDPHYWPIYRMPTYQHDPEQCFIVRQALGLDWPVVHQWY